MFKAARHIECMGDTKESKKWKLQPFNIKIFNSKSKFVSSALRKRGSGAESAQSS